MYMRAMAEYVLLTYTQVRLLYGGDSAHVEVSPMAEDTLKTSRNGRVCRKGFCEGLYGSFVWLGMIVLNCGE